MAYRFLVHGVRVHFHRMFVTLTLSRPDRYRPRPIHVSHSLSGFECMRYVCVCFLCKYVMAATASASCRGCSLTLFDFATITADDEKLCDFLVAHHVIAGVRFCDFCHEECRVERRRKLFRCDRQVTVKLYGGGAYQGHPKTFIRRELGSRYMVW